MAKLNISSAAPSVFPKAEYLVEMTRAELQETANKAGSKFCMWFAMCDPELKGQCMHIEENYENQSEKAQEIGRGRIGAIINALGLPLGDVDTDRMLKRKFLLTAGLSDQEGYASKNFIMSARPASKTAAKAPGKSSPPKTATPKHEATEDTSTPMPGQKSNFTKEEESGGAAKAPPYAAPTSKTPVTPPKSRPGPPKKEPTIAEILPFDTPTLSAPVENPVTKFHEATDSATGAVYTYGAEGIDDGNYHLIK